MSQAKNRKADELRAEYDFSGGVRGKHHLAYKAGTNVNVPEPDWKVFRELQQHALERFCKCALEEVQTILRDGSRSHHSRYLDVFRLLRTRDEELAHAFNDARRSRMTIQLAAIHAYGLSEPNELEQFTERTRATIESLAKEFTR